MATAKITTAQTLREFVNQVFAEGIKSTLTQKALTEKEKQDKVGGDIDDLFGDGGDKGGAEDAGTEAAPDAGLHGDDSETHADHTDKPVASKTMADEREKLKDSNIKASDVIDKLNSIRSGKSFKDSAIEGPLKQYIDSLSKAEKVALFAYVKGIAAICTGEIPAKSAENPRKHPADIEMNKTNEPHVAHKKPNVIKGAGTGQKHAGTPDNTATPDKQKPDEEDTSAPTPVPIKPKRRQ